MREILALVVLCLCLYPAISGAETRPSPPPFVIRSADELKTLPEFLQNVDVIIVPDAEVSACDPGKGLLSLMSLTPEQASQFWGMPKKRRPGSKSFLPEYSWENGYTLSFNKKGWLHKSNTYLLAMELRPFLRHIFSVGGWLS